MQTHSSKRTSWAVRLGVLTVAAVLSLAALPGGSAGAPQDEAKTAAKKTDEPQPPPVEGDVDTPQGVQVQKTFKSVGKTIGSPLTPLPPPLVDESGVAFGLRSTSLDERRSPVMAVAFSADGKVLATAGGALKLWDVGTAKLLAATRRPGAALVAFAPDGKALATVDDKGALYLRDPVTAKVRFALGLHGNGARLVAFSPDGKLLACAGRDGKLRWWDAATGKHQKVPIGEVDSVQALAFSRDGKTLVTSGTNQTVRVWDLTTGKARATLASKWNGQAVALSPDGTTVALVNFGQVGLWNGTDGKLIAELKRDNNVYRGYSPGPAQNVAFAPDGKILAVAHGNGGVALWDTKTRKEIVEIGFETDGGPPAPYYAMPGGPAVTKMETSYAPQSAPALVFSPDGKRLAVNKGNAALLFDVANRVRVGRLPPQRSGPEPVLALAYAPDGKTVAVALEDRTISVREVDTGEELQRLRGHGDKVTCLAFTADGKTVVTGSADRTVKVWDLASGRERLTFKGHTNWVYAVALAPDGKTVASGGYDRVIKLWDAATGQERKAFLGHKGAVRALAFNASGNTLASGSADRTIKLWDVSGPLGATTLTGHTATVRALAFSPDGQTLVSTSDDGTARSWDVAKREQRRMQAHANGEVVAVAFAPTGDRVATVDSHRLLWVWDPLTGKGREQVLQAHPDALTAVAFAPDGKTLATGSYDRSVRFWPGIPVPIRVFPGHKATVTCAVLSADGSRVLSGGGTVMSGVDPKQRKLLERADLLGLGHGNRWDNTVRLWDAGTGKELRTLRGHTDQVLTVAFSPNGRQALSAGHDRTIRRWELASGKTLSTLTGHEKAIRAVAYSPKGRFAVSGGDDRTVRLWDVEAGRQVRLLKQHTQEVRTVAFSPDGRQIVSGDRGGFLFVWDVAPGKTRPLRAGGDSVNSVVWTADGKRVVCAAGPWIEIYDVKEGKRLKQWGNSGGRVDRVALLPGDRIAASVGQDGQARFWDLGEGGEVSRMDLAPFDPTPTQPLPPQGLPAMTAPAAAAVEEDAPVEKIEAKEPSPPPAVQPFPPGGKAPLGMQPVIERSFSLSVSADGRRLLTVGGLNPNAGMGPGQATDQTIRLWKTPALDRPARGK